MATKWVVVLFMILLGNSAAIAWLLLHPEGILKNRSATNAPAPFELPARPATTGGDTHSPNAASIQQIREASFQLVEQVALKHPKDPDAMCLLGKVHLRAGNPTGAVEIWQAVLTRFPDHAEPLVDLGFYEQLQGNLDAAEKYFSQAILLAPDRFDALEALGKVYLAKENWRGAMNAWSECLSRNDSPAIRNQIALAAIMGKDPESTIAQYSESLVRDPSNRDATIGLVQLFAKAGDKERAKRYERRLSILDEERRKREDDVPRAVTDMEKVQGFARFAYDEAIRLFERHGDHENALSAREQWVQLLPMDGSLLETLLQEYGRHNRIERGTAFLRQLATTRPNDPSIGLAHAKWSLRQRAFAEAESSLEKVIAIQNESAEAYALLAQTQMPKDRNPQKGVEHALKALELNRSSFHSYLVATAYYNVGDKAKTREYLQKALELDPNNLEAKKAIDPIVVDKQIEESVVVEVRHANAHAKFFHSTIRRVRDILKTHVAAVAVEFVGGDIVMLMRNGRTV